MTSSSPLKPDLAPSASSWNPWPTGLVVVLGLFATGVFSFGVFAVRHSQDLVSPDYYDREIRHQEHMDQVTRTDAASSAASVAITGSPTVLALALPPGAVGRVELYRPANAQWDRVVPLALDPEGRQRVELSDLQSGLWRIRVVWKAGGLDYFREVRFVSPGGE